jgi:hypothetical protein
MPRRGQACAWDICRHESAHLRQVSTQRRISVSSAICSQSSAQRWQTSAHTPQVSV